MFRKQRNLPEQRFREHTVDNCSVHEFSAKDIIYFIVLQAVYRPDAEGLNLEFFSLSIASFCPMISKVSPNLKR